MTLTIELPPAQEAQLTELAQKQGVPVNDYALELLQVELQRIKNQAAIAVLDSFMEEDGEEQRETWEALQKGLEESRRLTRREIA